MLLNMFLYNLFLLLKFLSCKTSLKVLKNMFWVYWGPSLCKLHCLVMFFSSEFHHKQLFWFWKQFIQTNIKVTYQTSAHLTCCNTFLSAHCLTFCTYYVLLCLFFLYPFLITILNFMSMDHKEIEIVQ